MAFLLNLWVQHVMAVNSSISLAVVVSQHMLAGYLVFFNDFLTQISRVIMKIVQWQCRQSGSLPSDKVDRAQTPAFL